MALKADVDHLALATWVQLGWRWLGALGREFASHALGQETNLVTCCAASALPLVTFTSQYRMTKLSQLGVKALATRFKVTNLMADANQQARSIRETDRVCKIIATIAWLVHNHTHALPTKLNTLPLFVRRSIEPLESKLKPTDLLTD